MVLYLCNFYILMVYFNYCYFEVGLVWWFGGGVDFMFYYLFFDDVCFFYCIYQVVCDLVYLDLYKVFKFWCDEYFYLKYCGEICGVGGIFYDY